jgi:Tfp pilus assembly protein PilN
MRAVNLLPLDLRGNTPASAPSARPQRERADGIGAYLVLGALALCVAMLAVYVMATNTVKQKQTELAEVTAKADAAAQAAAKLKPYADFEAMASTRIETVRGLAAARFDWEQALRDLSRAMPADVKLQSLTGDMGLPGTSGVGGDPLRGSIQAPAISLGGCAASQPGVARLMARLRAVDGVTRVSLSKSEKATEAATAGSATGTSACEGKNPPTFSVVVFFEGAAALAAMAPPAADAATAPNVPVPNAVNGGETADGSTPAPDAANSAQAPGTDGSTTSTTTTTTPGAVAP